MSRSVYRKRTHFYERNNRFFQAYSHRIRRRIMDEELRSFIKEGSEIPALSEREYHRTGTQTLLAFSFGHRWGYAYYRSTGKAQAVRKAKQRSARSARPHAMTAPPPAET